MSAQQASLGTSVGTATSGRPPLRVLAFLRPYRWWLFLGLLLVLLSSATLLSFPYFAGKLLDVAAGKTTPYFSNIKQIFFCMLALVLAQGLFSYLRIYCTGWLAERAVCDLRQHAYEQLLLLPVPFYDKHRVGDLASRLQSDLTLVQQGFSTSLVEAVRQISVISVGLTLIFSIAPQLSLLLVATLPLLLLIGMYFGRMLRRLSKEKQSLQGSISTTAEESLQLIHTIKAFTAEALQGRRYAREQQQLLRTAHQSTSQRAIFVALLLLLMLGSVVVLLTYGAMLVEGGDLSTGDLLTFVLYTTFIGGSVATLGDLYGQIQKIRGAADRLDELFAERSETDCLQEGETSFRSGDLCVEDLHFCYPSRPEVKVLKGLRLRIPTGSRVALVGPSGAGKSTLLNLLLRYYTPQKGEISIGGCAISEFPLAVLRQQIGIVPQETILFGGSVADNIRYGCPSCTEDELRTAAERAYVMEFAARLPQGLETRLGERGATLSGGERQRVAIARAMLKNPKLLLLDEATSALDSNSEQWVQEALQNLMQNRTTLIIAHRLATIREVDCIYVLKEGQLVEAGTHNELQQQQNGLYRKLIAAQTLL